MTDGDGRTADPFTGLKRALDGGVDFPAVYVFKFIVPVAGLNHLLALLDGMPCAQRESKTGKYVSVTVETVMTTSDDIIDVYRRTAVIDGLMSL